MHTETRRQRATGLLSSLYKTLTSKITDGERASRRFCGKIKFPFSKESDYDMNLNVDICQLRHGRNHFYISCSPVTVQTTEEDINYRRKMPLCCEDTPHSPPFPPSSGCLLDCYTVKGHWFLHAIKNLQANIKLIRNWREHAARMALMWEIT